MDNIVNKEKILNELSQTFKSGKTKSYEWRKTQLKSLFKMVEEQENKCFQVLFDDIGKDKVEAFKDEVGPAKKAITYALDCLKSWMAPKKAGMRLLLFPAKGELIPEPYGLVLIMTSWNYPLDLALEPLIGAIAAGNVVVLKPSEHAPATSSFLANTLPQYLDNTAVKVIEGGAETSQHLLQYKWDKIFYTGSPKIGRIVMSEAAKHLTPVTLELGGKCPMIFDYNSISSNLKVALRRLASAKWGPACGQACIAVDYLLVEDKFASSLIDMLSKLIRRIYGENIETLGGISRIVNKHHFNRLCSFLKDPMVGASIVHGGSYDEDKLLIEPTILLDPPLDSAVMNEEIFGPILPIITLKNIQESINFINMKTKPLVIYAFTHNDAFKKRIISETSSGTVAFNDVMIQYVCDELPFGGVGESGIGRYHGKFSFETFSHEKAVLHRGFFPDLSARYPPYNAFKLEFCRLGYKVDYINLVLLLLGLRRVSDRNDC
ncbi:aldehyde dehydrogenase family 3 member F1 [Amaranthus tricolor]|uniref:aldehyde dehydrogenase family 3 member F1 n=1 Tax=Amaranthus tricolor TaxID=29722 RepID=UPI0025882C21|nr:aldehyde dehydrogenase family 3 member F1 [Amaranthus tricolor]